jgi:Amt family ammonium transporter
MTMLFFGRWKEGHWDLSLALNGILAGMIASCAGVNVYELPFSLLVGFTGAFAYWIQEWITINLLHVDDPLSASALHMGAGFWGVILAGLVASEDYAGEGMGGLFTTGNPKQLGYQIYACTVYFAWAFGSSSICFMTLNYLNMFRVPEEEELEGLDLTHHGGPAYSTAKLLKPDAVSAENSEESEDGDSGTKSAAVVVE